MEEEQDPMCIQTCYCGVTGYELKEEEVNTWDREELSTGMKDQCHQSTGHRSKSHDSEVGTLACVATGNELQNM
eukprot:401321-Amphidinium_carterae.1